MHKLRNVESHPIRGRWTKLQQFTQAGSGWGDGPETNHEKHPSSLTYQVAERLFHWCDEPLVIFFRSLHFLRPPTHLKMAARAILLLVGLSLAVTCAAIYADQVGQIDWNQQYVGSVQSAIFHGGRVLVGGDTAVAALSVRTGSLAWRRVLPEGETFTRMAATDRYIWAITNDCSLMRAWSV